MKSTRARGRERYSPLHSISSRGLADDLEVSRNSQPVLMSVPEGLRSGDAKWMLVVYKDRKSVLYCAEMLWRLSPSERQACRVGDDDVG